MKLHTEELEVGDKIVAAGHPGHAIFVGGTVTEVHEAFGHIFKLVVIGGHNINRDGKARDFIAGNASFTIERTTMP